MHAAIVPDAVSISDVTRPKAKGADNPVHRHGHARFAPGETTKTITVEVKGDSKREANPGAPVFTKNRGLGTILNDD